MPVRNLRDGSLKIKDGAGTPAQITCSLEEGDLSWTQRKPANIILDRGVLDHSRLAPDEPVEVSFTLKFQSLSKHATTTEYDALTKTGGAAAWVSDESNSDVYAVILEFTVADPGGGSEVITFTRFIPEEISFQEGDPYDTLSVTGRAVITAPSVA